MSYTDETVYRLRDIIDEYTDIAQSCRREEERKEELLKFACKNNLTLPEKPQSFNNQSLPSDIESADKVIVFMEECIYDYKEKRKMLNNIRRENQWLEEYLKQHGTDTPPIFVNLP